MVNVTINAQRVLNRIQKTVSDITAIKLEPLIDDAIADVETQLGVTIGELAGDAGFKTINVLKKYASVITNLSAAYALNYMSGKHTGGLTFRQGTLSTDVEPIDPQLKFLIDRVNSQITELREEEIPFIVGEGT